MNHIIYKTEIPKPEDIFKLYQNLGWIDYLKIDQQQLFKAMEASYYSVYAYQNNQLVGTGRIVSDGIINSYICGLGVDRDFRNQGIGSAMFKNLSNHCQNKNLQPQIFCEKELIPYYQHLGFTEFAIGMTVQ